MFEDLDPRSPTPLYEQIARRIRLAVATGELKAGDSLPSVRQLAGEIRVNPATVVQAYRDLAEGGFVETRHGAGTFVRSITASERSGALERSARDLVEGVVLEARRRGIHPDLLAEAFESVMNGEES